MSFTDQKPRIATEDDLIAPWSGGKPGEYFRCYLCGHQFVVGDQWRWVYSQSFLSFFTCKSCDGDDVKERWVKLNEEARTRFWWFRWFRLG
jgi:hypothetical protein